MNAKREEIVGTNEQLGIKEKPAANLNITRDALATRRTSLGNIHGGNLNIFNRHNESLKILKRDDIVFFLHVCVMK